MKQRIYVAFILAFALSINSIIAKDMPEWVNRAVKQSDQQLSKAVVAFESADANPRTIENGTVKVVNYRDWTSGFYPGSLWYMYELTGNESYKKAAESHTRILEPAQFRLNTHDLGFILFCSYGNAYRLTTDPDYMKVMTQGAHSLMKRYNPKIGVIKSWDPGVGPWEFPVIIDNMMNLEFLYTIGRAIGDSSMMNACVSHANRTMENHFRNDNSSYHVIDYDVNSGDVISKQTHQGLHHESSWARGQAWGLYGFTMMYRMTFNPEYLRQAEKIADFIIQHPRLPEDKIPYWDFDVKNIPNEPRDASAAAIMASALLELYSFKPEESQYFDLAEAMLKSLSSTAYLASPGENGLFLLKHATGNMPFNSEIDTALAYADYYFLEALLRYQNIIKTL